VGDFQVKFKNPPTQNEKHKEQENRYPRKGLNSFALFLVDSNIFEKVTIVVIPKETSIHSNMLMATYYLL